MVLYALVTWDYWNVKCRGWWLGGYRYVTFSDLWCVRDILLQHD